MSDNLCEVCGKVVLGYVPKRCCNSFDCECQGKPINPCICSEECYNRIINNEPEWLPVPKHLRRTND